MKKIASLILLLFVALSVFAKPAAVRFHSSILGEIFPWEFGKDEGMFFLLEPESDHTLVVHVDKFTSKGLSSDVVSLACNATLYRLPPESTVTCYGNFNDVVNLYIDEEDYKNGAKGHYTFQRVTLS